MSMKKELHQINRLSAQMNLLYHQAALKLGITDSGMQVLYTIFFMGDSCPLRELYAQSPTSKQTINSALNKLEYQGILYYENQEGRNKTVCLTQAGKELMEQTAAKVYQIEEEIFSQWPREELDLHIALMERYNLAFAQALQTL